MPREKVTTADVLKELRTFPCNHALTVYGSYYDTQRDEEWGHRYNVVIATSLHPQMLEGLQSRLERMTRLEFREFLCQIGVIGIAYTVHTTTIFNKPTFDIKVLEPGTPL